jgi:di/tricarboxylate transporter
MVDGLRVSGRTVEGAFAEQRLRIGDVLLLRGNAAALAAELEECGLMVLAQPKGQKDAHASLLPILIFASGIGLTAFGGLSPELAFGLVVLAMALTGSLSIRRGLETMNWPILIMLGAMIPIGAAVETTGLATSLVQAATGLLPVANLPTLIAAMVVLAALLTPLVNNPATFLMLAPIAVETAGQYGVPAEPLILAVGVGASLDFLTPFGHHNNTLVMGLGGYSFADFLRLGAPLLLLTVGATILVLSWRFG